MLGLTFGDMIYVLIAYLHYQKEKATYITWKQSGYQDNPISEEQDHNEWKKQDKFAQGLAVITGKVLRGEHARRILQLHRLR